MATNAEEMAALVRDRNAFDMLEVLRKCEAEAVMKGKTFTLKVSDSWKAESTSGYNVSVDAETTRQPAFR